MASLAGLRVNAAQCGGLRWGCRGIIPCMMELAGNFLDGQGNGDAAANTSMKHEAKNSIFPLVPAMYHMDFGLYIT